MALDISALPEEARTLIAVQAAMIARQQAELSERQQQIARLQAQLAKLRRMHFPAIDDDVDDPVHGFRAGVHIGEHDEIVIQMPALDWEEHVRQEERQEYEELVDFGLREPYSADHRLDAGDQYEVYLRRIGDDKDGFHDPMTRAIWHWARAHPADLDEEFKAALRAVVRSAKCIKQRDLDEYLADYRLDASLKGAREKCGLAPFKPTSALERYRGRIGYSLSHSRKDSSDG